MKQELQRSFPWKIGYTKRYFAFVAALTTLFFGLFGVLIAANAMEMKAEGIDPVPISVFILAIVSGGWLLALAFTINPTKPYSVSFGRDVIEVRSILRSRSYRAAGNVLDVYVDRRIAHYQADGVEIPGIVRPVIIVFKDGERLDIPENIVRGFGQSPEGLADTLRQLYQTIRRP